MSAPKTEDFTRAKSSRERWKQVPCTAYSATLRRPELDYDSAPAAAARPKTKNPLKKAGSRK